MAESPSWQVHIPKRRRLSEKQTPNYIFKAPESQLQASMNRVNRAIQAAKLIKTSTDT